MSGDEEEPQPGAKRRRDEDDDAPRSRKRRRDEDDDDDEPRPRKRRRDEDEDEVDDDRDYRPRRRRPAREEDDDPAMGFIIPGGNTSALAIVAGYMGLFSVLCLPAPIALLLGILALVQLKKNPKLKGYGRAIFAVVMGAICMLIPVVIFILSSLTR